MELFSNHSGAGKSRLLACMIELGGNNFNIFSYRDPAQLG